MKAENKKFSVTAFWESLTMYLTSNKLNKNRPALDGASLQRGFCFSLLIDSQGARCYDNSI